MSSVIAFLEALGCRAEGLGADELAAVVQTRPTAEQRPLLDGDSAALAMLIGARATLLCSVAAPDHEPLPDEQPEEPADCPDQSEPQAA